MLKLFKSQSVFEVERDALMKLAHVSYIIPIVDVSDQVYTLYPDFPGNALVLAKAEKSLQDVLER